MNGFIIRSHWIIGGGFAVNDGYKMLNPSGIAVDLLRSASSEIAELIGQQSSNQSRSRIYGPMRLNMGETRESIERVRGTRRQRGDSREGSTCSRPKRTRLNASLALGRNAQ